MEMLLVALFISASAPAVDGPAAPAHALAGKARQLDAVAVTVDGKPASKGIQIPAVHDEERPRALDSALATARRIA